MSVFLRINTIFRNATKFRQVLHKIDAPFIDGLITETGRWFKVLGDENDDNTQYLKMRLWLMRSAVIETLLPFDSSELGLNKLFGEIRQLSHYNPNLSERISNLSNIIDYLLTHPANPKAGEISGILAQMENKGNGSALVMASSRLSQFLINGNLLKRIKQIAPACKVILNRKMLMESTYTRIILPSGGRNCPFIKQLHHGYLAEYLDIITYSRERIFRPERTSMPAGSYAGAILGHRNPSMESKPDENEITIEDWEQKQYWEVLRGTIQRQLQVSDSGKDTGFLVSARLVILGGKTKIFLNDDSRVIEISDLIEGRAGIAQMGKRFPRRFVSELREGDLIVHRTSGSGDYLLDVARSLVEKSGKTGIYDTASLWKKALREALEIHGTELIARKLSEKGVPVSNPGYTWMWTTWEVIKPLRKEQFTALIEILASMDRLRGIGDPVTVANEWWRQMKEIIRFHMKAGQEIRKALLQRLTEMIKERIIINDTYSLTLPGVDAGEMSVFRVLGIDSQTVELPFHHTNTIIHSE